MPCEGGITKYRIDNGEYLHWILVEKISELKSFSIMASWRNTNKTLSWWRPHSLMHWIYIVCKRELSYWDKNFIKGLKFDQKHTITDPAWENNV